MKTDDPWIWGVFIVIVGNTEGAEGIEVFGENWKRNGAVFSERICVRNGNIFTLVCSITVFPVYEASGVNVTDF